MGIGPAIALSIFLGLVTLVYLETSFKIDVYKKWSKKEQRSYMNGTYAMLIGSVLFPWFIRALLQ